MSNSEGGEPSAKRRLLNNGETCPSNGERSASIGSPLSPSVSDHVDSSLSSLYSSLESCYHLKCLCQVPVEDVETYVQLCQTKLPTKASISSGSYDLAGARLNTLLYLSFLSWVGETFHNQLLSGEVCSGVQRAIAVLLKQPGSATALQKVVNLLKVQDENIKYLASQALKNILPLCHCGQDITLTASEQVLVRIIQDLLSNISQQPTSLVDLLAPGEEASLDLDLTPPDHGPPVSPVGDPRDDLDYHSWLMTVISGLLRHGGSQREDLPPGAGHRPGCLSSPLEEELLCQETQVKCLVIRTVEPHWARLTSQLHHHLAHSSPPAQLYLCEGYRVWRSLISVKANLSFIDSRVFTSSLSGSLPPLQPTTPAPVWRSVLDTVSECLCYGSTLGLQSIAPEEPCQLAHGLIRLVRFNSFLSRVPHRASTGFGGSCGPGDSSNGSQYDKGLVQKMVLLVLKCVALTVREARCESSSGESDSSLSSQESGSSCDSSDMILIERNMMTMYKSLDTWIKAALPILPDQSLQESVLHLLSEQDDVLVEGLLCLLDTHLALYVPGKREPVQGLLDINPTKGFRTFLGIVNEDPSVLLDFLVSNETCFLLYILRYLKHIVKDWTGFVQSCDNSYHDVVHILLNLKESVSRLVNKSLFPYNIGPVFRLLEKVEFLHTKK